MIKHLSGKLLSLGLLTVMCTGCLQPSTLQFDNSYRGSQQDIRISLNEGWKFMRYTSEPDKLIYDVRPEVTDRNDNVVADTKPTEAVSVTSSREVLKNWILPTANDFIKDPAKHHQRP